MNDKMTKSERVELGQLIRKRERVMKSYASERAAQMLAEFDRQSAELYSFDQDEIWNQSTKAAEKVVAEANGKIAARCKELGIPAEFAPSLSFGWMERGQNSVAGRRAELRRMAVSKIKAIEAETITKIERLSLTAQTEVLAHGMESDAAKQFLESMPSLETLMPSLDAAEIKKLQDAKREQGRNRYE
ncbi:MAG TPA: hypothetical protein VIW21_08765 [Chthoniobacterales bacterium]|jgi:hypothetical protein